MKMWVHRATIKAIVELQKQQGDPADAVYECIGAWRYFEAIALWLAHQHDRAHEIAAKVRTDKFTDTEVLLRLQKRIATTYRQHDPFTNTCVAAHQQRADWQKLYTNAATDEQRERILARHAMYRLCQPELNPQPTEQAA